MSSHVLPLECGPAGVNGTGPSLAAPPEPGQSARARLAARVREFRNRNFLSLSKADDDLLIDVQVFLALGDLQ